MNQYEEMLDYAYNKEIEVFENETLESDADALIGKNVIGLSEKLQTQVEKKCALAEELSHHEHNIGNITDQDDPNSRWQEQKARKQAVFKLVRLTDIIKAFEDGVRNRYELAEYLDVTEKFLDMSIDVYRRKYGNFTTFDNYIICFDNLRVGRAFDFDASFLD